MTATRPGRHELRLAQSAGLPVAAAVAAFSAAVNLLMLTGPIFMLQVYDRVLASRSVETLAALTLLMTFLFLAMGLIDVARGRIVQRIAARFQSRLEARVFAATLRDEQLRGPGAAVAMGPRDLEAVSRFVGSPTMLAIFDLPWTPLFAAAIFVFHPLLGAIALGGGVLLVLITLATRALTRGPLQISAEAGGIAQRMADLFGDQGETLGALGMRGTAFARWHGARAASQDQAVRAADLAGGLTALSRGFRLFLQSLLLAAGAWLVLRNQLTPGAMIASSIMMGRALAPVDQLVAGWAGLQAAQDGWQRLGHLLTRHPPEPPRTPLPRPQAQLDLRNLTVAPPGAASPTLRGVNLALRPGQAIGVIGASGAGKSTLARALTGAWTPLSGTVRLGGATLDQYDPDVLGGLIGYLPQQVTLFDGTIAENIARLAASPDPARVVEAARAADAHRMILDLPQGYDTRISQTGGRLSGGQIQRIGLARALYPDPVILVLDEPNSNLDHAGSEALNAAIRRIKARGGGVIIMAHRPAAITECEYLLVLEHGVRRSFGPRDKVLREVTENAAQIAEARQAATKGGAA
nr:type I secretion system permease/ATPase [Paracoccus tibetensis]